MTRDELREAARDLVRRTTAAQGLPYFIEDAATVAKLAALIGPLPGQPPARRKHRTGRSPDMKKPAD